MSRWLAERAGTVLSRRTSRRGFLARATLGATALSVAPAELLLRPVSAYAAVCRCGSGRCSCGQACCDGYTEFCCTVNHGSNTCPPGTFAGGWWKADGSRYCHGPRYYIDCMAMCSCGCGGGAGEHFCPPGCDGLHCGCATGDCSNRAAGCVTFRYGQCHTEIACSGRIACRVVSCTPAYLLDNSCGSNSFTDEATANHNRACLEAPTVVVRAFGLAVRPQGGFWMCNTTGGVFTYGGAPFEGSAGDQQLAAPTLAMAATPDGNGYWLVASDGGVFTFGTAPFFGALGGTHLYAPVVALVPTPTGRGYWLAASDGGVFCFGDAGFFGSAGAERLTAPVVAMAATATGQGYWLVCADGGVLTFGNAGFFGSMGGRAISTSICSLVPTPDQAGYYLLGQDGAIYAFGSAPYLGRGSGDPALLGNGVDSYYGMSLNTAATQVIGYEIYAVAGTASPPAARTYSVGASL
jgi:hypothetical protein